MLFWFSARCKVLPFIECWEDNEAEGGRGEGYRTNGGTAFGKPTWNTPV